MPKLKESPTAKRDSATRGAIARAMAEMGLEAKDMGLVIMATSRTFYNRLKDPAGFTLREIRRMDEKIKFTDAEILAMVRGREK